MRVSETVDVPLCVKLRALLKTDIYYEAIFHLIKKNILYAFALPIWLLRGKSALIQHGLRRSGSLGALYRFVSPPWSG